MLTDTARAFDALHAIPPDLPRDEWVRAGMAAQSAGLDFDAFNDWSAQADSYDERDARDTWRSFKPGKGVGAGTLFKLAAENGWRMSGDKPQRQAPARVTRPVEPPRKPAPGMSAAEVWQRCEPATAGHGYIVQKQGNTDGLRVVPAGDSLTIAGQSMAGYLAVPAYAPDGTLHSIQFIPGDGGKKLNLPGASMAGASLTMGTAGPIYLCEGIGAAWACWQSTGHRAVCCFGWGNVRRVAESMRQQDATAKLVICPDRGKESDAEKIAAEVCAAVASMPDGWPQNSDVNDLFCRDGFDVLAALLESATEPPVSYPVSVAFADELPERYDPPDELIEGVLTSGDGSVLYGDSNSGKTFLVIDMACAVARGVPWMGRRTEPGMVVYRKRSTNPRLATGIQIRHAFPI